VCVVEGDLLEQDMADLIIAVIGKVGTREAGRIVVPVAAEREAGIHVPKRCAGVQLVEETHNPGCCDGFVYTDVPAHRASTPVPASGMSRGSG
jgi:hypothetical protein